MRIANFKDIDRKAGLSHFAKQSLEIYEEFNGAPESELRSLVLKILENKR